MGIRRNITLEDQINDAARTMIEAQNERRSGIHFSDLLTPRQGYFKHLMPKPPTDAEVGFFVAGRAHHEVILSILKRRKSIEPGTDEGTKVWKVAPGLSVFYSPDHTLGFLGEVKTNRSPKEPLDEWEMERTFNSYIPQVKQYMVAEEVDTAVLIVFFINLRLDSANKTTVPTFRAYQITMTPEERKTKAKEMKKTAKLLKMAIEKKDHTMLPLCAPWMCASGGYRGKASARCKWYESCKPEGRYPIEKFQEAARRGDFKNA